MDTLSSSVSTLHSLPSISHREFCHLRTPISSTHLVSSSPSLSTNKPTPSLLNTTNNTTCCKRTGSVFSSHNRTSSSTSRVYHKAASGYAAALIDIARCNNSIEFEALRKDVSRLSRLLNNKQVQTILKDPFLEEKEKAHILEEVAEKGKFHKHLVVLLKLLIGRKRVGIVNQVLQEFQRIYDELSKTQVVLVPSAIKMEKQELLGIAKRMQKISGAVKVKVRHIVDERLAMPSSKILLNCGLITDN